ncbi:MAG: GH24 family phage-related lysozyme (muramidase) [Alphaproteobacteria bacterium]|jgi:GH24 family phage-related lysozyme (muramidase)
MKHKKLLQLIKHFEGVSRYPYLCPAMHLTIGCGHLIKNNDFLLGINGKFMRHIGGFLSQIFKNRLVINQYLKDLFYNPLSPQQVDVLLEKDIAHFAKHIKPLIKVPLLPHQNMALISLTFNIGVTAFKNSTLLKKLNRSEYRQAAQQFDRWIYAKGKRLKGLIKRRSAEKKLFLHDDLSL